MKTRNGKRMRSLFDITEDFVELEAKLDAVDDLSDDLEAMSQLLEWMTDLSNERAEKIDAYCWFIRKLQAESETAKQVAAEFREKANQRENKVEMMKSLIMQHMKTLGHPKLFGKKFTVAIQKNGGSVPVLITDEDELPENYCQIKLIPNKDWIRQDIEAGKDVPGARLGERGESIRIK
jgi:hypothetical protein